MMLNDELRLCVIINLTKTTTTIELKHNGMLNTVWVEICCALVYAHLRFAPDQWYYFIVLFFLSSCPVWNRNWCFLMRKFQTKGFNNKNWMNRTNVISMFFPLLFYIDLESMTLFSFSSIRSSNFIDGTVCILIKLEPILPNYACK